MAKENPNIKGSINKLETYHTDAYMIAVKNGFKGTEEEWLYSLAEDANIHAQIYASSALDSANKAEAAKNDASAYRTSSSASAEAASEYSLKALNSAQIASNAAQNAEEMSNYASSSANTARSSAESASKDANRAEEAADRAEDFEGKCIDDIRTIDSVSGTHEIQFILNNGTVKYLTVKDGVGIQYVALVGTTTLPDGRVEKQYIIHFTDGTDTDFVITDGKDGDSIGLGGSIDAGGRTGQIIVISHPDGTREDFIIMDGINGKDGITPHVGSNGNWWIGNTDTGINTAPSVVQTPGDSETVAMSQKATTELAEKITDHKNEVYASATPEMFSYEGFISSATGRGELSSSWMSTDYIPVSKDTIINSNSILGYTTVANIAYYDNEKNFISCIAYNSTNAQSENKYTITNAKTPDTAKYVKLTVASGTERADKLIVDEWTKVLTKEDIKKIANEHIPKIASRNLMTLKFENARRHDSNGQFTELNTGLNSASSRDYIEVEPNETYTFSWNNFDSNVVKNTSMYIHQYDENKAFIKYTAINATSYTGLILKMPENCHYISLWLVEWNNTQAPWRDVIPENLQMEKGYRATPYVHPDVIDSNYIDVEALPLNRFDPAGYGLPVVEFVGNITGMNKDNAVTLNYTYGERSGSCTLKWQGTSSASFPKKNYTVKFDSAFEAKDGWGVHDKYCLKADWVDFSHCRNVVSAKLWGDIVRTRATSDLTTRLAALPNGGAIDGFPCFVVINGEWQGIYNFDIPKEDYLFGMGSGTKEAIVCAENTENCLFKGEITLGVDLDLEYAPDSFTNAEIQTSLNRLINAVKNSDGTDIDTTISQYVDIDSAIDYMIFVKLIHHWDGVKKNYILATYDGTKWFFSAYDMDLVYGNNLPENNVARFDTATVVSYDQLHTLFKLLYTHCFERVKARYEEIVNGVMAKPNVTAKFTNYMSAIPKTAFISEAEKWKTIPSTSIDHIGQIVNWYGERVEWCTKEYF